MKVQDKYFTGSVLGAVSPLFGFAVSWLLVQIGLGTLDIFQLDSIIVTVNRPNRLYGLLVNLYAGGVTGFLLVWLLEKFGRRYVICKAVAITSLAWFIVESYATAFFEGRYIDIRPLGDYGVHIIGATAVGLAMGVLFKLVLYRKKETES